MDIESPYFRIENTLEINSINEFIDLSKQAQHGFYDYDPIQKYNPAIVHPELLPHYETTGIFRGQNQDWPLIPSAYRELDFDSDSKMTDFEKLREVYFSNMDLDTFGKWASDQNNNFPKSPIERMCIAQHYGIKTPLLDWTSNIFVAAYFALDIKKRDYRLEKRDPYIYHLRDERRLKPGIENEKKIESVNYSAIVKAYPIDRRLERQFSVFSFHPQPYLKPEKIPITKYKISDKLSIELWKIMGSIGFSSAHLFPDYAGLVDRIKKGYMI